MIKPNTEEEHLMKKFKTLLSLITITILLTSCGSLNDLYGEKYGDDWLASTNK
jgi:hypothetical protein